MEESGVFYTKTAGTSAPPATEPERQQYFMKRAKMQLAEISAELGRPLTCCINTFGCQMNARDSEKLLGILETIGYEAVETEDADFVLYNTCTVRENANLRVYGRLGQLGARKKKHPEMMIALCGCMMQEKEVVEKIKKSYRYVDLIFGTHNIFKLAELVSICLEGRAGELAQEPDRKSTAGEGSGPERDAAAGKRPGKKRRMVIDVWEDTTQIVEDLPVERKYPFKSGVNIMFGCNNFCSYCIVPYVRGRERSRRPEEIIKEIKNLVADGVVEVMLLGQNVNSYGKNLESPMTFAELLQEVEKIDGLKRIRFMTSHPKDLSDELIQVMARSEKICRHLHLPLQSGSSRILKVMNRRYTKEQYLALAEKIKAAVPGISLTTDIIVGFPGETEADFEETLDVVRRVRFDSAFTFIYSKRTGTPAASMEDQVPEDVVKERFDRLLKEVQDMSAEVCGRDLHTVQEVLVEEVNDHSPELMTGRMSNNTIVHFPGDPSMIGRLVNVYLEESKGFYYMGRTAD
ncbi:tRNA (N6-isopentenyl adenosine(37)-C2)-methylthiotransferase MiaB [Lacrimispora sp. 210928-DFI.3.58]|uniref:tRNA (N6-isopentenyl adenosine(37)-C2)-methylthiotransferase MiaB n=1 Tax=Lacrimispora sp. 210928-DFI.3.58 TaxID=2883214 RepID=UPI001D07FB45|nr:tRNA (N6-isopentenyl adenosine(37)-C2)-methylthiotransferase MiaB [Lacrimispora sp. 210928-DFI.3.58]MCB7317838.1 tRNA (N6-isopentenyl adenosine(37)-C2)-methylthiotransferase MiaB [Lacrimispora sp. 210928-DFI.3.58]